MSSSIIEQGTPEWHALRCGKLTASRIKSMLAKTKSGWGASRKNYAADLVAERMTGVQSEGFMSPEMKWGKETEPEARLAYELSTGFDVVSAAFVDHPTISMSGASPDGLVGDDGLVEIKCPNTATHIDTLLSKAIPSEYILQMQWQMDCTGRKWCDFVSYDPRMPQHLRLFVSRLTRDDKLIAEVRAEAVVFLREIDATVAALDSLYDKDAA